MPTTHEVTRRARVADQMLITTTTLAPAVIDFADILAAARIESDHNPSAPGENDDVFKHEIESAADFAARTEQETAYTMRGYVWRDGWSEYAVITIPREFSDNVGRYDALPGESKQAAAERAAADIANTITWLKTWYKSGGENWEVISNYGGYSDSLSGFYSYEEATEYGIPKVTATIIRQMQADGYTITNSPYYQNTTAAQAYKARTYENTNSRRGILVRMPLAYRWRNEKRRNRLTRRRAARSHRKQNQD